MEKCWKAQGGDGKEQWCGCLKVIEQVMRVWEDTQGLREGGADGKKGGRKEKEKIE